MCTGFWSRNLWKREHMEAQGVDVKTGLGETFSKQDGRAWT